MLLSSGVVARRRGVIMKVHHGTALTGPSAALIEDYRCWLVTERSLAVSTVRYYVAGARLFLSEFDERELRSLTLGEVTGYVVRRCPRLSVGNAKNLATSLRSLLGYLYLQG
jgi:integrase/recombinase XerD